MVKSLLLGMMATLLSIALPTYAAAQEQDYSGYVGPSAPDGNSNSNMRVRWADGSADVLIEIADSDPSASKIVLGTLDNSTDGILTGEVSTLDGEPFGSITLRKRVGEYNYVIWSGSLEGPRRMSIEMRRQLGSEKEDITSNPLIVTSEYTNSPTKYDIPQDLFVYARPRIDTIRDGLAHLDREFPYWRNYSLGYLIEGNFPIDYLHTDIDKIGEIVERLRSTGAFDYVELGIAEYGGMPEQIIFSKDDYPFADNNELYAIFKELSKTIAEDYFCAKLCSMTPMSTKSSNVRAFEILGRSEDLHFKRQDFWEKYTISMTIYSNIFNSGEDNTFDIQFQIVSAYIAPSGNGDVPPSARFKENPIDSDELSRLSSKLQMSIAEDLGAEYQEEF